MSVVLESKYTPDVRAAFQPAVRYLLRPARLFKEYDRSDLHPDLVAGLTVGVILLPQAIAFALIAELPPEMGLYAAIVGAIIGALWCSSHQMHTGPANAISLLVLSTLLTTADPGTPEFVLAAGLLTVMVGVFQLVLGLARLGILVNFVSHSVIVGFAGGAGVLIAIKQLLPLLGLSFPNESIGETVVGLFNYIDTIHAPTAAVGLITIVLIILVRRINSKLPSILISMVIASALVVALDLDESGVDVIGQLPRSLPPLADLPWFNLELIGSLSAGALAIGAIGLVETVAISRSIAVQTGQRLDSNQEFVGQGLANIVVGILSGYPVAGSFSRSAVNTSSGARTPLAAVFSSLFVVFALFALAPLAAYLPRTALAGVLIMTAFGMVDRAEIGRIWQGTRSDALIMLVTFLGTLFLDIEFAVLLGILLSFGLYILRTSTPRVQQVLPDDDFRHFAFQPEKEGCPQLSIVEILGDLYFGAVNHVEEEILKHLVQHPTQRFLLLRMLNVNHCDFSGIHMLENLVRSYREAGGDVFMVRVSARVKKVMQATGFDKNLGYDHFLAEDEAVGEIFYRTMDPAICIYECPVRAFRECQNLPKRTDLIDISFEHDRRERAPVKVTPQALWKQLQDSNGHEALTIVDVREPREYKQAHIPQARLLPLSSILSDEVQLPDDRRIVLVCRSGRRSQRAALVLRRKGFKHLAVLEGGMLAWESADLLQAVG